MREDDDDEEESSLNATRYPCMPSLVALQQMRNRLHLAHLGRKLMKWTALATGRELRRLAFEIDETYKNFTEDMRTAFMLVARGRYFYPNLNNIVLENVAQYASVTVATSTKSISGVKVLQLEVIETGITPYEHLGIDKGGQTIHEAKMAWLDLLKRLIVMLQQRTSFYQLEQAHKSATKKKNVLSKILIPRIVASIRYILTELEENEREETFRLKRVKQNKIRALEKVIEVGAGEMTEFIDRPSGTKVIKSVGKTIEGPPVIVLPTTESGDPLVVIKPPESAETGDNSKSTQQFQTIIHENGLENVDKKQDLQDVVEKTVQLAEGLNSPETNKLFRTSKALLISPKVEEPGETLDKKSGFNLNESVDLREGSPVQNELNENNTPDTLLEHVNGTQKKSLKSLEENISRAEELQKRTLSKTEGLQVEHEGLEEKGKKVYLETSSHLDISESSERKESTVISLKETEDFHETSKSSLDKTTFSSERLNDTFLETSSLTDSSSNREIGENKLNKKIKPPTSDENIQDEERIAEQTLNKRISFMEIDRKVPSEISSTISQPESTKLFDELLSPDIISDSELNQEKLIPKAVENSVLSEKKPKELSIKSPPEISRNEIIKSKSSVRIKLAEDNTEEYPSRSDQKSPNIHPDKNMASKTEKKLVETQEKMTEGSVEKLGEGDSQMYTGQAQNIPRMERNGSVEGIVDVEPYFETGSISKPSVSGVEEDTAGKSIAELDGKKDVYYEADIELDETDIDISTSGVAQSSTAKKAEVEEAESVANTNEQRHDSDVEGSNKRSKSPDVKKRQS